MSDLKEQIKASYAAVVEPGNNNTSCCGPSNGGSACCGSSTPAFNEDYSNQPGYVPEADFGLGCGIPLEYAGLEAGQTVLDLGAGAGNDVFVARSIVGESGQVIGVDMTPEMIAKANQNKEKLAYQNVEFVLGDIEELPLPDASVDVAISNCVLKNMYRQSI